MRRSAGYTDLASLFAHKTRCWCFENHYFVHQYRDSRLRKKTSDSRSPVPMRSCIVDIRRSNRFRLFDRLLAVCGSVSIILRDSRNTKRGNRIANIYPCQRHRENIHLWRKDDNMNFCFCPLVWIFIIDNHRNVDSRSQWREFSFICFQVTERTRCMWACIYQAKGDIVVITSTIILNVKRTVPIRIMSTTIGPVSCRRLHFCFHIFTSYYFHYLTSYSHLFPRRNLRSVYLSDRVPTTRLENFSPLVSQHW